MVPANNSAPVKIIRKKRSHDSPKIGPDQKISFKNDNFADICATVIPPLNE